MAYPANVLAHIDAITTDIITSFNVTANLMRIATQPGRTRSNPMSPMTFNGWTFGDSIRIKTPTQYNSTSKIEITPADYTAIIDNTIEFKIDYHDCIPMAFTGLESLYEGRTDKADYTNGIGVTLAQNMEDELLAKMDSYVYNFTGTAGVDLTTTTLGTAKSSLEKQGILVTNFFVDSDEYDKLFTTEPYLNNYNKRVSSNILDRFEIKELIGIAVSRNLRGDSVLHSAGVGDGVSTPALGIVPAGTIVSFTDKDKLTIDGLTAETTPFKKGDFIYVESVKKLDPRNHAVLETPFTMKVRNEVVLATGQTQAVVTVDPEFLYDGTGINPLRNISQAFTAGQPVILVTAHENAGSTEKYKYRKSYVMNNKGIMWNSFTMPTPYGIDKKIKAQKDVSAIKIVTLYSGVFNEYKNILRSDVTSGSGFYSPFLSCLISGKVKGT